MITTLGAEGRPGKEGFRCLPQPGPGRWAARAQRPGSPFWRTAAKARALGLTSATGLVTGSATLPEPLRITSKEH